jgi:DMSO/TMAO reductase YedYZ heme-binding membrane subunit
MEEAGKRAAARAAVATRQIIGWVIGLAFAYAIVRYNVARDVAVAHLPLYIANKAIALAATALIGISYILGPFAHWWPKQYVPLLPIRKTVGLTGYALAAFHAIASLLLLSPAYYARFYGADGKFSGTTEFMLSMGILAFLIFSLVAISSVPSVEEKLHPADWLRIQRYGLWAYFLVLLHVAVMGYGGWFRPESYQFGLASITLIASLVIVLVFVIRALAADRHRE